MKAKNPVAASLATFDAVINPHKLPEVSQRWQQVAGAFYAVFLDTDTRPLGDSYDVFDPAATMKAVAVGAFVTLDAMQQNHIAGVANTMFEEKVFDSFFEEMFPDDFFVSPEGAQSILCETLKRAIQTYRYAEIMANPEER